MIYDYLKKYMLKNKNSNICDEHDSMTYAEMLSFSQELGETLAKHSTDRFGILCNSNLNTAKAILACFYAKKTAVVLSHRYGDIHNKKIIDKIGLTHIITDNDITILTTNKSNLSGDDLSDVALIMCTSGTTGDPKGAMITQENLIANLQDIGKYFSITSEDKIFITRPLYHCAVLTGEFLISLIKGLDIFFTDINFNPAYYVKLINKYNHTVMCGTPTMMYYITKHAKRKNLSLRTLVVSGECMTETVAKNMRSAFPDANIYNVYGLTEASPRVSYLPPELFDDHYLSVGFPLQSVKIKTENGELLINGKNVMKGYYNDPITTAKVINDGWLHTGDIVEVDTNGLITIKSRKDDMIIRAGMNIYPQEIENALKSNNLIEDVVVFGLKKDEVGQKICMKVVSKQLTRQQIFSLCKRVLPIYQIPDIIDIVDYIPKNASGKVIRKGI